MKPCCSSSNTQPIQPDSSLETEKLAFLKDFGFDNAENPLEYRNKDNFISIEINESCSIYLGKGEDRFPLSVLIGLFNMNDTHYGCLELKTEEDRERFDKEEKIVRETDLSNMDYCALMIRRIVEDVHFFDEDVYKETSEFINHISSIGYGAISPRFIIYPSKEGHMGILGEYTGLSHGDRGVRNRIVGLKDLGNGEFLMDYEENDQYLNIHRKIRMIIYDPESVSSSLNHFSIGKCRKIILYDTREINGKEEYHLTWSCEPKGQKVMQGLDCYFRYRKVERDMRPHEKQIDFIYK